MPPELHVKHLKSCSSGQLSPFLPRGTWLGLPFCLLSKEVPFLRAFNLKKLPRNFFFPSILFMEGQMFFIKASNPKPFDWNGKFQLVNHFFLENIVQGNENVIHSFGIIKTNHFFFFLTLSYNCFKISVALNLLLFFNVCLHNIGK